jgi:hypothetical protein
MAKAIWLLTNVSKTYTGEKTVFLRSGAGNIGCPKVED